MCKDHKAFTKFQTKNGQVKVGHKNRQNQQQRQRQQQQRQHCKTIFLNGMFIQRTPNEISLFEKNSNHNQFNYKIILTSLFPI